MRNPSLQKGGLTSGKQPMSVELTSGTGERTFYEAALRLNRRRKELDPADLTALYHRYPKAC